MVQQYDSTVHGPNTTTKSTEMATRTCSQLSKQPQVKTHSLNSNKCNWKKVTETIFLAIVFVTVWCLFAVPTVLYALSASQTSQVRW